MTTDDVLRSRGWPLPVRLTRRLEEATILDDYEPVPRKVADALVASRGRRQLLQGEWLGHALHPLLTDLPLGAWIGTAVLDLAGGKQSRPAATKLLTFGVVAALPTAITGLAEWARVTDAPTRRVGLVHAALNVSALVLYSGSLIARRRGQHRFGVGLGLGGGLVAGASGHLGGHMSLARKVGSRHPAFDGAP